MHNTSPYNIFGLVHVEYLIWITNLYYSESRVQNMEQLYYAIAILCEFYH
jgi:hypothetical protein